MYSLLLLLACQNPLHPEKALPQLNISMSSALLPPAHRGHDVVVRKTSHKVLFNSMVHRVAPPALTRSRAPREKTRVFPVPTKGQGAYLRAFFWIPPTHVSRDAPSFAIASMSSRRRRRRIVPPSPRLKRACWRRGPHWYPAIKLPIQTARWIRSWRLTRDERVWCRNWRRFAPVVSALTWKPLPSTVQACG
jgi:hypothetical protein